MERPSYQTQDFTSLGINHINMWRPAQGRYENDFQIFALVVNVTVW